MKTIQTEIIIQAPAHRIWNILMDFGEYASWNPFITQISGQAIVGKTLSATLQPPGNPPMIFNPTVLVVKPEEEFRWLGHLWVKGVFDGEHFFRLVPLNDHETKLIHGEHVKGILSAFILRMIKANTLNGFQAMNEAIKKKAEYSVRRISPDSHPSF